MSTFDTDNTLLLEMLGKGGGHEVFTTAAQTGKDFYCVFFPVESVITSIVAANFTGETALAGQTMAAGTTLFMRVTAITLTSGIGFGYRESDGDATK
jgi:hypothetical protein|tara:strand:- start:5 stop:295 length:291 start_codon:yes stop_codon:yes gene_type:complete